MAEMTRRLEGLRHLPALPASVLRLVSTLQADDASAADVERIVRSDEAIAAAVLRAANSARGGRSGRVFTLQESIARLGTRELRRIAFAQQCSGMLHDGGTGYGLRRGDLWRGALAGALAAEAIARRTRSLDPGLAYVAAMLRDVGKLAMSALFGDETLAATFVDAPAGASHLAVECAAFGVDHAELGAELVRIWGLPDRLVAAVRHHHAPPDGEGSCDALVDVVHCADVVASWLGCGIGHDGLAYPLHDASFRRIGIDRPAVEVVMCEVRAGLDSVSAEYAAAGPGEES